MVSGKGGGHERLGLIEHPDLAVTEPSGPVKSV